jgi:hypothetical protein
MKIEKNIPIPDRNKVAATLRAMSVGDSVIIPKGRDVSWRASAAQLKMKVTSRKISDTECRLWRIT